MRAEADRCRDNDVEAISRPGQVLHRGLQLPGLSFKVRHDVEVVVAAEHGKPVLQCEGCAGSRTHSLHSRAIAAKYELEFLRANKQYPILADSDIGQDLQFDALRLRSSVPPLAQALAVLPQWWYHFFHDRLVVLSRR